MPGIRSKIITLDADLVLRCKRYGPAINANLANPDSRFMGDVLSAALTSHGIENKPEMQADAKGAECAYAIFVDLNPITDLQWEHADNGKDIIWKQIRVDVKHTPYANGRLVWPINKNRLLATKRFDVFVLVTGRLPTFEIRKWIRRDVFLESHSIEVAGGKLTPGTWYMTQDELWPIETLQMMANIL